MPTAVATIPRSTSIPISTGDPQRPPPSYASNPFVGPRATVQPVPSSNSAPIPSSADPQIAPANPAAFNAKPLPTLPADYPSGITNPGPKYTVPKSSTVPPVASSGTGPPVSVNPAPIPSAAPSLPMPIGANAGIAQAAKNAVTAGSAIARAGAGSSAVGAVAGAGAAIALGAEPGQAIAGAAGSAVGGVAGAVVGGAIGSIGGPAGIAVGATIGQVIGSLAGGALAGGIASDLSPANYPPGNRAMIPITYPSGGLTSDGLYRVTVAGNIWYKNDRSDLRPFTLSSQYLGSRLPSVLANPFWNFGYNPRDGWLKEEPTGVSVTLITPGSTPLGGETPSSAPSNMPGTIPPPVVLPTDENGNPINASPSPNRSASPSLSPIPGPGSVPSLPPAPSPAINPKAVPNASPYPNPNPASTPGGKPAPSPAPAPYPGSAPNPKNGTSATPDNQGRLKTSPEPSPQIPKTPSTRSRNGDCCDPIGGGGDCKFKPLEFASVTVKTFLGCLPIAPYTPLYGAASVNCIKGTEDQTERIFNQIAELGGLTCKQKDLPTSKVSVLKVICGKPDKHNPPAGLIKQPVQVDSNGYPLPEAPYHEVEVEIPCLKGLEDEVKQLYSQIAAIRKAQCTVEDDEYGLKIYQILGGDAWFHRDGKGNTSTTPKRFDQFDSVFRKLADDNFEVSGKEKEKLVELHSLPEWIMNCFASLYYRTGIHEFPTQVTETLTSYSDESKPISIYSLSSYLAWFIRQFDLLVGQFPIEIEIEDTDPATKGNQSKKVELPNLSEAIAELYGTSLTASTNADLSINFLMRLSAEMMATKNAALITQDYAKANASFLGYRGNPKQREIDYSFNPTRLDSLEDFLQNTKGSITGWGEDDKESVVGYLQRLMFSAGIIKAVFMRNSKQMNQLSAELKALLENPDDESAWKQFIDSINSASSPFNQGVSDGIVPLSKLDNKPVAEPSKPDSPDKKQP